MAALALALCLAVPLGGCRARIIDGDRAGGGASDRGDAPGENREAVQESDHRPEGEPGSGTRENPEASRREYDENAAAEITAGTDRLLHAPGEGDGAPRPEDAAELSAAQTDENADETAEQTVAAPEADRMGVSEDAEEADSAMTYYTVLLQDRLGTLFECQRATAYWETADDHVTVYRTSPEHAMILEAGCYDASARLLAENLRVDDGWVARKNPGLIVKVVRGDVLGGGAASTGAAKAIRDGLMAREGWSGIDAVRAGRVLLVSEEALEAPHLRTLALLAMAKTANPQLFSDVDLDEALQMLWEEAVGTAPTGTYVYAGEAW